MMPNQYFINPLIFAIDILFSCYILAVMLRLFLQWVRTDFHNPVAQFLITITQPTLRPLRRYIPPIGNIDTACITLLLILALVKLAIIASLTFGIPSLFTLLMASIGDLIGIGFKILEIAIIFRAVLSWVMPNSYNPALIPLYYLTNPTLEYIRNFIPLVSGIDLSPIIALFGLEMLSMFIDPLFPHFI
ncbi:YggT family protein [Candidatus Nitrosacidococcus sp. I8]|uniref:YggT family protein n=1 Tax=Candidatus Nitrosacidococcus sp. I8 TaxID=2942908 RepID=UPI002225C66B|nr:YggT family protein [Candidatus Nitrosacidococcus sp. I8]CAH9019804.1 hypothetical protein NURINAE_01753 [Candidatus Nitrosacidococcus sp. I8]